MCQNLEMNFRGEDIWSPYVWKWYENLKIVTRVSLDHESSKPEKNWKKSLQCCSGPPSWASGSWWPSCSSCESWRGQIHPKFLISHQFRAHYRNPKSKCKILLLFINNFSQNTFWNLKPLNQPACQIRTPLHCECNISMTIAGIIKWLGYTIHRIPSYNWFKFEDLTPTGSDSREHQKV